MYYYLDLWFTLLTCLSNSLLYGHHPLEQPYNLPGSKSHMFVVKLVSLRLMISAHCRVLQQRSFVEGNWDG